MGNPLYTFSCLPTAAFGSHPACGVGCVARRRRAGFGVGHAPDSSRPSETALLALDIHDSRLVTHLDMSASASLAMFGNGARVASHNAVRHPPILE